MVQVLMIDCITAVLSLIQSHILALPGAQCTLIGVPTISGQSKSGATAARAFLRVVLKRKEASQVIKQKVYIITFR